MIYTINPNSWELPTGPFQVLPKFISQTSSYFPSHLPGLKPSKPVWNSPSVSHYSSPWHSHSWPSALCSTECHFTRHLPWQESEPSILVPCLSVPEGQGIILLASEMLALIHYLALWLLINFSYIQWTCLLCYLSVGLYTSFWGYRQVWGIACMLGKFIMDLNNGTYVLKTTSV